MTPEQLQEIITALSDTTLTVGIVGIIIAAFIMFASIDICKRLDQILERLPK